MRNGPYLGGSLTETPGRGNLFPATFGAAIDTSGTAPAYPGRTTRRSRATLTEVRMAKELRCRDVGMSCDFQARGETEDELRQATTHARTA
jgi:Protein of unknown function (DUF1059)